MTITILSTPVDAPLSFLENLLKPMEPIDERLEFLHSITERFISSPQLFGEEYVQAEYLKHIGRHPQKFSWKLIAETLYMRGNESFIHDLFCLVKSPKGCK